MRNSRRIAGPLAFCLATTLAATPAMAAPAEADQNWVGGWGAPVIAGVAKDTGGYPNTSIRNVVRTSVGGDTIRIRLANTFNDQPVRFDHVTVAESVGAGKAGTKPGTMRDVTFNGSKTPSAAAGKEIVSDPIKLAIGDHADLAVTTFVRDKGGPVSWHQAAIATTFEAPNDKAAEESGRSFAGKSGSWYYLSGIDVSAEKADGTVVAFGDSITDGVGATMDTNRRWPDLLAQRLSASDRRHAVINAGISANRLLTDTPDVNGRASQSALTRFDRDVLSRPAVRSVIITEGVNDINSDPNVTPTQLTDAIGKLVEKSRAKGVRALCGTILPYQGTPGWDEKREATRTAVNKTIRGGRCDGVVDFDATTADPANPKRMLPAYDSGDHLHPGDAGYEAMAKSIDLNAL